MIANYHTHTPRCNHAIGREEDYVRCALDRGFRILGFSDHTPQFFPGDYYSHFRMRPEQLKDYCDTIRLLQKKYAGRIEIPLGLEVEYYPDLFPDLLPFLRDAGIEYMLLGQHFVGNEYDSPYSGSPMSAEEHLKRYCAQSMDAMQTGLFTYFAHPDLIHFKGDSAIYRRHMRRLCREAQCCGIPLELNLLGKGGGRHYPNREFWAVAAEEGCKVVIGSDAHAPEHLLDENSEREVRAMIGHFGLLLLDTVPLRPIG